MIVVGYIYTFRSIIQSLIIFFFFFFYVVLEGRYWKKKYFSGKVWGLISPSPTREGIILLLANTLESGLVGHIRSTGQTEEGLSERRKR